MVTKKNIKKWLTLILIILFSLLIHMSSFSWWNHHVPMVSWVSHLKRSSSHPLVMQHSYGIGGPLIDDQHDLVGGIPTPLKIWKSVGMIIPNIWKNKKCSKPPIRWLFASQKQWFSIASSYIYIWLYMLNNQRVSYPLPSSHQTWLAGKYPNWN